MLLKRYPSKVFTPGVVPGRAMFARRNEVDDKGVGLQDRVLGALRTPGLHVLLHGDTGVGKSTLLGLASRSLGMKMIDVNCYSNDNFDTLIDKVLAAMVKVREISRVSSKEGGGELGGVGGSAAYLNVTGTIQRKWGTSKTFEVLRSDPRDAVIQAMRATKTSIIQFDNFHNVTNDTTRALFAQFLEGFSNTAAMSKPETIAVLGIAADAASLLSGSTAYTRRVRQILVPRMSDDEIRHILKTGFDRLELSERIGSAGIDSLTFYSDGFPYYAHSLGLHTSEALRKSHHLTSADALRQALALAADEVSASYESRYKKAVELRNTGTQPRTKILQLLAHSSRRLWSGADVSAEWALAFGERDNYSFLWSALGTLTSPEYGLILTRTGTSGRYEYEFADPHLRPFIRMRLGNPPARIAG